MGRDVVRLCAALALVAFAGCYAPKVEDCKVRCGPDDACPAGTACSDGMCRPPAAEGACDCATGDEQPCGGGPGACTPGTQRCLANRTWGQCVGEGKPSAETCDGIDNDCNGLVDDKVLDAPQCELTAGVCAGKKRACAGGRFEAACSPSTYGPDYEVVETRCDGLDNDCNGTVDQAGPFLLASEVDWLAWAWLDGGYGSAYVANRDGGGPGVYYRYFDTPFSAAGGEVQVAALPANPGFLVGTGRDGLTYAVWTERDADGGRRMSAVAIDRSGASTTIPLPAGTEMSTGPDLALGPDELVAAWLAKDSTRVRAARLPFPVPSLPSMRDYDDFWPDGGTSPDTIAWSLVSPAGSTVLWATDGVDGGDRRFHLQPVGGGPSRVMPRPTSFTQFQLVEAPGTPVAAAWVDSLNWVTYSTDLADAGGYQVIGEFTASNDIEGLATAQLPAGPVFLWTETDTRTTAASLAPNGDVRRRFLEVDAGMYFYNLVPGEGPMLGLRYFTTPYLRADAMLLLFCPP